MGATTVEGRADILVQIHGKPLAVFELELKRLGIELTPDDEAQGLLLREGDESHISARRHHP